jgi:hypothetical protein
MAFSASPGKPTTLTYRGRQYPAMPAPKPQATRGLAQYAGEYRSDELGTSYVISVQDSALILWHQRRGSVPMTRVMGDDFSAGGLRSVEFQRDTAGRVTGFAIFVDERTRHIPFSRVK